MPEPLYADNAATSFPKPDAVWEAMEAFGREVGASAGRGAYRAAATAGDILADARRRLARLLGSPDPRAIVFTLNCSAALNLVLKGFLRPGDHVVTSRMDHNSILRPLSALAERSGVRVTHVAADGEGRVNADDVLAAVCPETRLVALAHASNVTGTIQPIEAIAADPRRRGAAILVDAAQTAGHVPIHVSEWDVDFLAVPGHKGLLGPLGTGALYIRPGRERDVQTSLEGGTGSASERPVHPDFMPDKFEAGSHNLVGIAGLGAALEWIEQRGVERLWEHDRELSRRFLDGVAAAEGVTLFGPREPSRRVSVFSVRVAGLDPAELSALLESEFGILTRSGLHCAPLAHESLGTIGAGGTTRLSFGPFTTLEDVDRCAAALAQLSGVGAQA